MAVHLMKDGVGLKKATSFPIKICYKTVISHPFLVAMFCFLISIYRSYPLLFSLFLSASPVLVCTAVLLGLLLSFGQSDMPEKETAYEDMSLRERLWEDDNINEKDKSNSTDRFADRKGGNLEESNNCLTTDGNRLGEPMSGDSYTSSSWLLDERHQELHSNRDSSEVVKGELVGRNLNNNNKKHGSFYHEEVSNNQCSTTSDMEDDNFELDNVKSVDSFDSRRVNVNSPPGSPWKRMVDTEEEEDEEEDEASESGSEQADSSSPDASIVDIIPRLDELHPLLYQEDTLPILPSHNNFDAASEQSLKSNDSSDESDGDADTHEELDRADGDNEDGEDEEEIVGEKEDGMRSAISWTEEDQKNLMDLGSSELERNQRLELLLARRKAWKNTRMLAQKNLIDFENADRPTVAPISTHRHNPFDLPTVAHDQGLSPVPGSAPSILLPRKNPFDLPYDSGVDKINTEGNNVQQEFVISQPNQPYFRRHESFSVGPSFFASPRQERQGVNLRPYFVPERLAPVDELHYTPFPRQSSEVSDSKGSSIPDSESTDSFDEMENKILIEKDMEHNQLQENREINNVIDEDISMKAEHISMLEHTSQDVGHGSQSSEGESKELGMEENGDGIKDIETDLSGGQNAELILNQETHLPSLGGQSAAEINSKEDIEGRSSGNSSSSSLSETSYRNVNGNEAEVYLAQEERKDHHVKEPEIPSEPSLGRPSDGGMSSLAEEIPLREPVYDTSPQATRNNSSCSASSELHSESEESLPIPAVKRTISFVNREMEARRHVYESNFKDNETLGDSTKKDRSNKDEPESTALAKNCEVDSGVIVLAEASQYFNSAVDSEYHDHPASVPSRSSIDQSQGESSLHQHGTQQNQVYCSSLEADGVASGVSSDLTERRTFQSSVEQNPGGPAAEKHQAAVQQVLHENKTVISWGPSEAGQPVVSEVPSQSVDLALHSSCAPTSLDVGSHREAERAPITLPNSISSQKRSYSTSDVPLGLELMKESNGDHKEVQESSIVLVRSIEEVGTPDSSDTSDIQDLDSEESPDSNSSSTQSVTSSSLSSETTRSVNPSDNPTDKSPSNDTQAMENQTVAEQGSTSDVMMTASGEEKDNTK